MDTRQRLLNNFGPIRHAILTSSRDPQQRVHVVYGIHSTDFVLSNMKEELETRTGLRLVLPDLKHDVLAVKESPFLATLALCRNTLVVLEGDDTLDEMYENLLQLAVKEAEHPDGRTVFIQRERKFHDWVLNKLETSTLMIYPHDAGHQLNKKADFWATVTAFLESADMDTRHQRILNNFGPIQHAILMSSRDPQQRVHVVYGIHSTDFVFSNMKKELETRTGLRLVLPDLKHDVLAVKESPFLATFELCRSTLVVLDDDHTLDEVHENLLQHAVKEAEHPHGRTVFIRRGRRYSDWVFKKLATCTLMIYPHDARHQLKRKTDFWPTVAAFLDSADMDTRQRILNTFGPIRHAILTSSRDPQQRVHVVYGIHSTDFVLSNMKQELETRTGLRLVLPDLKHDVLHVKESPFLATLALCRNTLVVLDDYDTLDEVHEPENTLQQAMKEAEHPDGRTVFIQRGSLYRDWVLNKLETNTLIIYPHDAGHHLNRKTDFWATVAAFLEDVDMDPHQRSLLNSFGPVRHALLTSSHDPQRRVHVVYDADSSNFVLTELKQEVEKRTKLTLILPDMNHNPLSEQEDQLDVEHNTLTVKGNEFLAKLASCRMTCVVVGSDRPPFPMYEIVLQQAWGDVYGNILQQAAKEAEHAGNQIVFLQREETCPDWVLNRLETCTVMMYPERQSRLGQSARFWRELPAVFEDVDMDPHQRSLLNSFGPVRHALLTSSHDPQGGVHVVYDADSSNFVLKELKQEVEKRTKLTLILPDVNHNPLSEREDQLDVEHNTLSVKRNEFLAKLASCRKTCVIVCADRSPFPTFLQRAMSRSDVNGNILQQAVKEAEHAGSQIVFIQREETCPDWVLNRLETCTVMMYPECQSRHGQTARFWRALAVVFETSDMDLHHQRLLNSFGPVRHAALTSSRDPQQGVHVVYDAESSNVVLTELKHEMEERTGLRLVLPDMEHKALSEQGNQPDDTLTMQGSEFCATLALCRKTCVVLDFRLRYSRSGAYDKMMQQAVKEAAHPDGLTVFLQRGETCPDWVLDRQETCTVIKYSRQLCHYGLYGYFCDTQKAVWESLTTLIESKIEIQNAGGDVAVQTGETRDKQSTQYQRLELCGEDNSKRKIELTSGNCGSEYSDSPSSQSVPVKFTGPVTNADTDEGQQTHPLSLQPPGYVSTAPRAESQIPSAEDTSEGKSATDAQRIQNQTPLQPIFSSEWQTVDTVTSNGGTVRKQYSDVILTVPPDAVDQDSQVDIHTAVCTDVDRVRRVLKLSEDECVSSPVAEYWAGHEFRFKKPVTITLPHFLPPDPDPSLVRVCRVTRRPDGEIVSTRLRPQPLSSIDATPVNEHGVGTDHPAVSQAYQREDAAYRTAKEAEPTLPTDAASPAMKADDFPEHCLDQDVEWEEAATFQLTTGGHVIIITNRFSGYVCTYCGRHGPPVLNVLVCGTHTQESADRQTAEVSVHVWDGRIHIADFRQDYGIGIQNHILCSRTLDVLPDLLDSRLHMLLAINKHYKNDWQHSLGDNDLPLIPAQQRHDLRHVLSSCDTRDCRNSSHITRPISAYWMLETLPERHPQPWLQCAVYVCQVASNTEPSWSDRDGVERSASLPVKLPKQKDQRAFATQTDDKRDITTGNGGGSLPKASTQKYDRNGTTSSLPVSRQPPDVHGAAGYQNDHENTQDKHHVSDNHSHAEGVALNGQSYPPFLLEQFDQLTDSFKRQLMSGPSQNAGNPTSGASNFAQANGSLVRGQSAEAGAVGGSSYSVTQNIYINNQPMTNNIGKIQGETTNLASTVTSNHGAPPGSGLNQLANALPNNGGNNSALPAPWGHERNGLEYERNGPEYERNGLERVHEHEAAQLENEMEPDPQNGEHLTDTNNPVCSPEEDQM